MPTITDTPARGKIIAMQDRVVVFSPSNITYEIKLDAQGDLSDVKIGVVVDVVIRVKARKVWTVPSGGNFVDPIFGPPKRIQGRIRYLDQDQMVLHCGVPIIVALPAGDEAFDLPCGPLAVGGLANVAAMPGGTLELLKKK